MSSVQSATTCTFDFGELRTWITQAFTFYLWDGSPCSHVWHLIGHSFPLAVRHIYFGKCFNITLLHVYCEAKHQGASHLDLSSSPILFMRWFSLQPDLHSWSLAGVVGAVSSLPLHAHSTLGSFVLGSLRHSHFIYEMVLTAAMFGICLSKPLHFVDIAALWRTE